MLITLCLSLSLFHPAVGTFYSIPFSVLSFFMNTFDCRSSFQLPTCLDYETKETVNCAVIGILVFCFLCFLASAVQMVVTLPVAFAYVKYRFDIVF